MRCYFLKHGHITAVEELTECVSDEAAIGEARELFQNRQLWFEAFEVWDRNRMVYRSSKEDGS